MATLSHFPLLSHLRSEQNQYILLFSSGKLSRQGAGLSFWFSPFSAAVAQLPVEDIDATFMVKERCADFQDVAVQFSLTYRILDPAMVAARINFGIDLKKGLWLENPLERLSSLLSLRAVAAARALLVKVTVVEAVQKGPDALRIAVETALKGDQELIAMGLAVTGVQVTKVSPTPELEKALQTPIRESLQQKADEAVFSRRAQAVEKERAIKENELTTQIELARKQQQLIEQEGANRLQTIQREAEAKQAEAEAGARRETLAAQSEAEGHKIKAGGEAAARRVVAEADHAAEEKRVALWRDAPGAVAMGFAMRELAGKITQIQHLNLTPDLLGQSLQQFLRNEAGK
jgi:regulator of protease activity HflC (stomatin/prohibitin superfamily)